MRAIFLGTTATVPTRERNHPALYLDIGPEALLFDCGENTQRQIRIANLSPTKISKIFLTHWHGDHVLGLAGLLQSFELNSRKAELTIFGPEKTKERFHYLTKSFEVHVGYKVNVSEIKSEAKIKRIFDTPDYEILATKATHTIPCLAFAFVEKPRVKINTEFLKKYGLTAHPLVGELQRGKDIVWKGKTIKAKDATYLQKGKKITYIIDSMYDEKLATFAKDSDVLICESTFSKELEADAKEKGHMTAQQAGKLAKKAGATLLVITHFSQRYKDVSELLAEARKEFKNTVAARDFLEIKV